MQLTLLDGENRHAIRASTENGRIRLDAAAVRASLGWELEPQGLCRGDVCIPVRNRDALVSGDSLDLETLAELLGRPLAVDAAEGVAALGESAANRAAALVSLQAPEFRLPDLAGRMHSLSEHRGKKVLLIAYASW